MHEDKPLTGFKNISQSILILLAKHAGYCNYKVKFYCISPGLLNLFE